jgi:RNA polymerase sigma-70 factor (ECF subfamily)
MSATSNQAGSDEVPRGSRRNTQVPASKGRKDETRCTDGESLAAVVAACQQGDHAAHRQLYDSCHQNVFRLAVRMVGLQDAADITQQVFLQAFRSIGKFNGRSRIETWLYRLAVNESLQHLRRNRRWQHQALDREPIETSQRIENVDGKEQLELALTRIDPELRSIFLLREVDGLSYHDIAEALQIPEGTVGSRLNRARRELKQHLVDLGFEPH